LSGKTRPDQNGRKADREKTKHFKINSPPLEVADIKVEKNTTYVLLDGQWYNSVQFEFFDAERNYVDIYCDANYNPYLQYSLNIKEAT